MTKSERRAYRQDIHIEDLLIWTYQAQRAHRVLSRGAGLHPLERLADGYEVQNIDTLAKLERIAELGVRVDGGGTPGADMHPDAEVVVERLACMSKLKAGMLMSCGQSGLEYDWLPGAVPSLLPLRDNHGKPIVIYEDRARKRALYCPLVETREHIEFARKVYGLWWEAMAELATDLAKYDSLLSTYHVLPPRSPKEPWATKKGLTRETRFDIATERSECA